MSRLPHIAMAAGSACSNYAGQPLQNHVLTAIGLDQESIACSIRLSVGRDTKAQEALDAAEAIAMTANRYQSL